MKRPSNVKRACLAALYHAFQFFCLVAMGLVAVFIIFAIMWSLLWERND
jgi:hypothetical protein